MPDRLPYGRQWVDDDDVAAVGRALRADLLTTGPTVAEFEAALASWTGARFAAAVSSGTAALHAAYAALEIGPGDEVILPAMTFAATANAVLYLGARPVFADVDPVTALVEPSSVASAISGATRAVVAVDFAGQPADYPALRAVLGADVPIVADAAHSIGATLGGRTVGRLADLTCLSFHPVKHVTTGEGGAVVTDDADRQAWIAQFRSHGIVRDRDRLRRDPDGPWYHEQQHLGFNYRITDVQCALGLSQLRRLPRFLERRAEIAGRYDRELAGTPGIDLPVTRSGAAPAWHLYVIRVQEPARRRAFFDALTAAGLAVQVHYLPVYRHPFYEDLGYPAGLCPGAEAYYARAVSIPLFPALTDAEVDRVVETVDDVARRLL